MRRFGVGIVALALLGAAGCGSSAEEAADGGTVTGGSAFATQESAEFSIRGTIESLPRPTDSSYPIAVGDIEAGAQLLGLEAPGTAEEKRDWITALGVASPDSAVTFLLPRDLSMEVGMAEEPELGFDITQVSSWAEVGFQPDAVTLAGDFDADTLSPDLIDLGDGVLSAGEGEDGYIYIEDRTPLRPIGQPLRVGQDADRIILSGNTRTVQNWLSGQGPTLSDEDDVLETADQLDALGAITAYFLVQPGGGAGIEAMLGPSVTPEQAEQRLTEMQEWAITQPFGVVAIGTTVQDTSAQDVVVYHFGSESAAESAVEQVERVWTESLTHQGLPTSDLFSLASVTAEGATVVAVLDREQADAGTLSQMLTRGEVALNYL